MITFRQYLDESINDKGVFKAIFVIGLPGAGKSYTVKRLSGTVAPVVVNTDKAAEFLSQKTGVAISSETWPQFKDSAHRITLNQLYGYLNGALPLFIDGTSNDASNILSRIGILESVGYDVGMVFINTSLETALRRAEERSKSGRRVDAEFIMDVHARAEETRQFLQTKVQFFKTIVGEGELNNHQLKHAFKQVQKFFEQPLVNPVGKRSFDAVTAAKQKYLVPTVLSEEQLMKKVQGWYKS